MSIQEDRWAVTALTGPEKGQVEVKREERKGFRSIPPFCSPTGLWFSICVIWAPSPGHMHYCIQPIQKKCNVFFVVVCLLLSFYFVCIYKIMHQKC